MKSNAILIKNKKRIDFITNACVEIRLERIRKQDLDEFLQRTTPMEEYVNAINTNLLRELVQRREDEV